MVLFSLTGFGNEVLPALLQDPRVNLQAVFTHKYDNPYPYYQEKALVDLCAEKGVIAHFGFPVSSEQGVALLKGYAPDLILISSFREIVKKNVIAIPRKAIINMHSSLLPRYRGVCPTNAVLLRGEKRTGMTVHYVTERIDEGDILLQKELPIDSDETDCTLRKKLALLAGEMVPDIIDLFLGEKLPAGIPQNAALSTPASRPQLEDGFLERYDDLERMERAVRALNPFPGTSFLFEGKRLPVHHAAWLEGTAGEGISRHGETLECWKRGHGLRLW